MSDTDSGLYPAVGGFTQKPDFLLMSVEYRRLPYSAKDVLDYLLLKFTTNSNGHLSLSISEAMDLLGMDHKTLAKALDALAKAGIIFQTAKARGRKPKQYAVFWRGFRPDTPALAHNEAAFWAWANAQRIYFQRYLNGATPPALEPYTPKPTNGHTYAADQADSHYDHWGEFMDSPESIQYYDMDSRYSNAQERITDEDCY